MYLMGNQLEQKKHACVYLSLKLCWSRSDCTARASADSISINSTGSGDYKDYQGAPDVMLRVTTALAIALCSWTSL